MTVFMKDLEFHKLFSIKIICLNLILYFNKGKFKESGLFSDVRRYDEILLEIEGGQSKSQFLIIFFDEQI